MSGAAEDELADRAAAAEAQDDEFDVVRLGCLEQFGGHVAGADRLLDRHLDAALAQARLGGVELGLVRVAGVDVGVAAARVEQ